ncbi:MAG: hydrogenase maturation protease [Anaerolineales bacterium]|uniref:hydrogenase maturation protease n=1 Tax=Candidatus Villigracilis proximus TaxID=3140683 RepID=UPI00313542B3|nr:hydrogenase maturation protease [Anaerolineales bacterium]MBK8824809.1 hydrogenase maturation protease [Anaerolineales bacterium]MBK9207622.1 hydrogenase maturation protease [Anaerolineales bacterium]
MYEELQARIADKNVLLFGVGNRQRGDDGVGSYLLKRLQKKIKIPLLDGGDVPENYIGQIEASGANFVLIVDAADFGASPGEIALIELSDLKKIGASTHSANLSLLLKVIPKDKRPETLLVAIQPGSTSPGKGLSEAVRNSLDGLDSLFVRLFK